MKNKNNTFLLLFISLILSIGLAYLFPSRIGSDLIISGVSVDEEDSIINQKVTAISLNAELVTKIFYKGNLLGVLKDGSLLEEVLLQQQKKWNSEIGDMPIKLDPDIYTIQEKSFWMYENKDDEIIKYLVTNNLFVIDAYKIDIIKDDTIVDTIYVKSESDFSEALTKFALNFVDQDVYNKLMLGQSIDALTEYGQQDKKVYIEEVIKSQKTGASASEVYMSVDDIFMYLCYGKEYELEYYTVEEYDTVAGVATKSGLTTKQLMALNPSIKDEYQTLIVGDKYNITYFNSTVNVVVEKEVFYKEVTFPGNAIYHNDPELPVGEKVLVVEAANGYNDTRTTEIYTNGELAGYRVDSSLVIVEPITAEYTVGSFDYAYTGDIVFGFPCENAVITCDYYCYNNHFGVDFINRFNRYGDVLAVTAGTILENGWRSDLGNYYRVDAGVDDEGNSIILWYGHMNVPGFFEVGTQISRGQIIGQIGNTGYSFGAHVHIAIYKNGVRQDPCLYIACSELMKW